MRKCKKMGNNLSKHTKVRGFCKKIVKSLRCMIAIKGYCKGKDDLEILNDHLPPEVGVLCQWLIWCNGQHCIRGGHFIDFLTLFDQ